MRSFRPCSDCKPKSDFWQFQIVSWLIFLIVWTPKNTTWHPIFANQIQAVFRGGSKSKWMHPQSERSAHSDRILDCLLGHTMDIGRLGSVLTERWGARQKLKKKFARHLSSWSFLRTTRYNQSLLCSWHQSSRCTVKPAMTAVLNITMFISLFCPWVCVVKRGSSALLLDSASFWMAR